jgi:HEAT repeat protein
VDLDRQKLIERAEEINTCELSVVELEERVREVCSEYLIEAKVDVDQLLSHDDWRVRSSALDLVWWGLGATDGIDKSIEILLNDPDEDVRAEATLALYEASRGTSKESLVIEALRRVAADAASPEYVRESALIYLKKLKAI